MRLHLSRGVSQALEQEALLIQSEPAGFFRMLLRRDLGLQRMERAPLAAVPPPLHDPKPTKEPFVVLLSPRLRGHLMKVCNLLGSGSPSTVASHLILDWTGCSPLPRQVVLPIVPSAPPPPRSPGRGRSRSQPTKIQMLSLAVGVVEMLRKESATMEIRHTELLRNLLRVKMGVSTLQRTPGAPVHPFLEDRDHPKSSYRIHLTLDQVALIQEVSVQLGGGEKSTIVSHLILDFLGISPLGPGPTTAG